MNLHSMASTAPITQQSQILHIAEMNTDQIRQLNFAKTAVLLPGGILEQHGPYLPSFTDGYWNDQLARDLAEAIASKVGWSVVIFPTIPLGNSGANDIGAKYIFPGTYAIRFETLRAIFMDLATTLGEQGFQWIFILHGHGAPNHNRALDQACDYFGETFGGHMVNLTGLMPVIAAWDGAKADAERDEDGLAIHAGLDETSMMLALRPDLVNPEYALAKPLAGHSMESLIQIARSADWPGYFGSPQLADASRASGGWGNAAQQAVSLALKILDGLDENSIVRFGDEMKKSKADVRLDEASLRHEAKIRRQHQQWLKGHKLL